MSAPTSESRPALESLVIACGRISTLLGLLLVVTLTCGGCEKSSDETAGGATSEEGAQTAATEPSEDPEDPASDSGASILDALASAGFEPASDVPFDDEGALPEDVASAAADGQTALATHVLADADERYIQVAIATFDNAQSARAAASTDIPHVVIDNRIAFLFTFGDSPTIDELKAAISP